MQIKSKSFNYLLLLFAKKKSSKYQNIFTIIKKFDRKFIFIVFKNIKIFYLINFF